MSIALLLSLAAAQAPMAGAPALPGQSGLYRLLFEDMHYTLAVGPASTGIVRSWTQGYDLHIADLDCPQDERRAVCRFRLTRTPDGTPRDMHAGTGNNALRCRAELRYAPGPNGAREAWRVRRGPGPAGTDGYSTMRCARDRSGGN